MNGNRENASPEQWLQNNFHLSYPLKNYYKNSLPSKKFKLANPHLTQLTATTKPFSDKKFSVTTDKSPSTNKYFLVKTELSAMIAYPAVYSHPIEK